MPVVFLTHIPLLRTSENRIPFAGGELIRLPWEAYDDFTIGAFSKFRGLFEETAPIFFRVEAPDLMGPPTLNRPAAGKKEMFEMALPSREWDCLPSLGLGFILTHMHSTVDTAWTALLLAAPAAAPPNPRLSVTFAFRGQEDASVVGLGGVRIQGEAGQQFLFSPHAAGAEVSREIVERADRLVQLVESAARHPELAAAIGALREATHPSLLPPEQVTLAVSALESLLLPEVVSGLGSTLGRRVAALVAGDGDRRTLEQAGRALYDARSATLHGKSSPAPKAVQAALGRAFAQRLLGAAIEALAEAAGEDGDVRVICAGLDKGAIAGRARAPDLAEAPGLRGVDCLTARTPLLRYQWSSVSIGVPEGMRATWAPLIGLGCEEGFTLADGVALTEVEQAMVVGMQDGAVRGELGHLWAADTRVGFLGVMAEAVGDLEPAADVLLRVRDLAVVSLRLGGFARFVDPKLLGSYVFYDGQACCISTTVLAEAVLEGLGSEPEESVGKGDIARLSSDFALLDEYDRRLRHADVDKVLELFRRGHDTEFLPATARAGLLFAAVEAMLGRFRPPEERVQLEELVLEVAGRDDPGAMWFARDGRSFRKAVAHGYWDGDAEPLAALLSLLRPLVRAFVRTWLNGGGDGRPSRLFQAATVAAVGG